MLEQPASLFSFYVFPELLVFAGFISVFLLFRLQRANCVAVQKRGCGLQFNMRPLSDGNIYNDYHAISACCVRLSLIMAATFTDSGVSI